MRLFRQRAVPLLCQRLLHSYNDTNERGFKDIWEEPNAGALLADVLH
ncbi:hypothetical protein HMPREF1981_01272 [Bacteroides pyogenes F0041]|uniref:Uncharacterized protein n=1 Tax=Bacteroides pyogenes F0041 TaxID=1321819 RepID=U2CMU4_9BACE|nr:hypothetical protein HMPREF1981_01272 [Bacteroides pyogenes F0041]